MITLVGGEVLGAFLPGVGEGDDVVDLDADGNFLAGGVLEVVAGIGFVIFAGNYVAAVENDG